MCGIVTAVTHIYGVFNQSYNTYYDLRFGCFFSGHLDRRLHKSAYDSKGKLLASGHLTNMCDISALHTLSVHTPDVGTTQFKK
jgi:hypothetical protein